MKRRPLRKLPPLPLYRPNLTLLLLRKPQRMQPLPKPQKPLKMLHWKPPLLPKPQLLPKPKLTQLLVHRPKLTPPKRQKTLLRRRPKRMPLQPKP